MPLKSMNKGPLGNQPLPDYPPTCAVPEFGGKRYQTKEVIIDLHPAGSEYYFTMPLEAVTFAVGPPTKVLSAFDSDTPAAECLVPNSMGFGQKGAQIYSVNLEKNPIKQTLSFTYPPEWRKGVEDETPGCHSSSLRTIHNLAPTRASSALIQQGMEFLNNGFCGGKLVAESLAILSIAHVLQAINGLTSSSRLPQLSNRALANTLEFIEENLDQNIGLKDIAQAATMSLYHFIRCFKHTTGLTPSIYVTERRIARAKQMLEKGDTFLVDIAVACGFSSRGHLSKLFKRHTGMTPLHYRKLFQRSRKIR